MNRNPIKNKTEIQRIFKKGKRICIQQLCVFYIKKETETTAYLVTTSKKFGSKPIRNRAKRILGTILRRCKFSPGYCFIVLLQHMEKKDLHTKQLQPLLTDSLAKIGIITYGQ